MRFLVSGLEFCSGLLAFYQSPRLAVGTVRRMNDLLIRLVFLSQLAATLYMTGLIWFVQVVHYPLLGAVGESDFPAYEQRHMSLTTWVVAPPMLIEAATAILLFWLRPTGVSIGFVWAGVVLLASIWLSTAFLQVPCHEALAKGFDANFHQRLVSTNWIRTVAWSLRGLLVFWIALGILGNRGE